jgi:cytosine/adenosine deaminase-related metal-dependent hydrolase
VLGTDSLASNHQLSILEEIRTIRKNFPHIKTNQLLKWATSNGARALQMDQQLGSLEVGKHPGVLIIDTDLKKVKRLT